MAFIRRSEIIQAAFTLTLISSVYLLCAETPTLVPSTFTQPSHQYRQHPNPYRQRSLPGAASLRGRRPYQEDRLHCAPSIDLPDRSAGLFGVFDGHGGDDASDFAARSIRERFLFHAFRSSNAENTSFELAVENALKNAISDIDLAYRKHAAANDIRSGSTASVALLTGEKIVIANVGDSKVLLCSSCNEQNRISNRNAIALRTSRGLRNKRRNRFQSSTHPVVPNEGYCVKELTSDHHPDRADERIRIENSGGFVTFGSLPRVNDLLAVSRSIGDYHLKQFGVISEPEFSTWTTIPVYDKFIVLASDGIFEKMAPQDVCDVLHSIDTQQDVATLIERLLENGDPVIALPLPGVELQQPETLRTGKIDKHSMPVSSNDYISVDACRSDYDLRTKDKWKSYSSSILELYDESQITQIMAEILVELAFRAGSMDNLSAIVIPLLSEPG